MSKVVYSNQLLCDACQIHVVYSDLGCCSSHTLISYHNILLNTNHSQTSFCQISKRFSSQLNLTLHWRHMSKASNITLQYSQDRKLVNVNANTNLVWGDQQRSKVFPAFPANLEWQIQILDPSRIWLEHRSENQIGIDFNESTIYYSPEPNSKNNLSRFWFTTRVWSKSSKIKCFPWPIVDSCPICLIPVGCCE